MKTGIKKAGSDLQVVHNNLTVPIWHIVERAITEADAIPIASAASLVPATDSLSPTMEQGMRVARSQPEIRTALVEALVAQIEAGTYSIDSTAIAQKMLSLSFASSNHFGADEQA